MADNVSLIVNETIDNVVINPSITTEVIDVNVTGTDTYVDISVTPNLTIVNINQVTGGGGGGSQDLQNVTDYGATTDNTIFINTINGDNGLEINALGGGYGLRSITDYGTAIYAQSDDTAFAGSGDTGIYLTATTAGINVTANVEFVAALNQGITAKGLVINGGTSSTGNVIEFNKNFVTKYTLNQEGEQSIVKIPNGTSSQFLMADGTTYSLNNINSKQLQLNYLDSDNAIFDAFYLRVLSDGGTFESSNQLLSSLALLRSISYVAQGYTQQLNANKFVKLGGTSAQFLMADGSISTSSGGGANLTTSQTSTNFTINSDTGTDASVPLGNGTLAGASLNDYTSAEKSKLSGIAAGAEVNVNADWNATSGDAQILNKPTTLGIQSAIASGTDTYTATISGVSSYVDGAAYLIRFTNGNTTVSTLNINSLGAVALYRNNDGQLIGGDIENGGTMLCVYDSTVTAFRCIGTSPNDIIAYVTNAESIAITKGQPVYAFGGIGDRMTVKLAYNTLDNTSAQTVGLVMSTSIAAGQKGYIITQGQLDGLSTLSSPFIDGDTVYLGATAGTITRVKPSAPNHLVYLGVVTTASSGAAGRMYVKPQNGYELAEIHDVQLTNPVPDNNGLFYDENSLLWVNKSIATVLGYTPANNANVVQSNTAITGATNTKITYDSKGLVTAGTILIASDIPNIAQSQVTNLTTDLALKQDKSLSAYKFIANNTNATANGTEQTFRSEPSKAYSGATPTWTGTTAPSGTTNHTYSWNRIGNIVTLRVSLDYSSAGTTLTAVTFDLPSDCPTPELPSGVSTAADVISYGSGMLTTNRNVPATPTVSYSAIRIKSTGVYEINIARTTAANHRYAYATIQYFTT